MLFRGMAAVDATVDALSDCRSQRLRKTYQTLIGVFAVPGQQEIRAWGWDGLSFTIPNPFNIY